jgi:hypothetical protein
MTPETLSRAFVVLRDIGVRTRNREVSVRRVADLAVYCGLEDTR